MSLFISAVCKIGTLLVVCRVPRTVVPLVGEWKNDVFAVAVSAVVGHDIAIAAAPAAAAVAVSSLF